jgi:DNA-directed RNA polymerase subunit RPC12/RpoP
MPVNHAPLLAAQRWKLWLAFAAVVVSGALMWFDAWFSSALKLQRYAPTLIGTGLGLVALVAACLAVRCPSCGKRLLWHALSTMPSHAWLEWLLSETTCPRCGYSSAGAAVRSGGGP